MKLKNSDFKAFCAIPQVEYWARQLNESNLERCSTAGTGTRKCYMYGLYKFNVWICGRKFTFMNTRTSNTDVDNAQTITIEIKNVGHFLELYRRSDTQKHEFVLIIKQYLLWLQDHKGRSVVDNVRYSIKSFFREHDLEINFRFNKKKHNRTTETLMTLDDFKTIINNESTQIIEKAVFLCKFQRGLDSATFADRFNFQVWGQLVRYFGTENSTLWDLKQCPVPIKLTRVKTNYPHTGFLDTDAVIAIQEYIKIRNKRKINSKKNKLNCSMFLSLNEGLFVDTTGKPISINWIGRRFHKLYCKSKCTTTKNRYSNSMSHELRDLLKSTLIDSGCRSDVADHVIGHAPKDSYEKQALLYPDSLRNEFSKCSTRINFLTRKNAKNSLNQKILSNHDNVTLQNDNKFKHNAVIFSHLIELSNQIENHKRQILILENMRLELKNVLSEF